MVHAGPHLMNAAARRGRRRDPAQERGEPRHRACTPRPATTAIMRRGQGPRRLAARTAPLLDCDMVVVAAGIRPNVDLAVTSGFTVERAIVVDDQMRTRGRPRRLRGRRVRAAPRRGVRPGRAALGAGGRAGRPGHRRRPRAPPTTARGPRPSSRSPASTSPRWACRARNATPTSTSCSPSPSSGVYKSLVIRDEQAHRRDAARRHSARSPS